MNPYEKGSPEWFDQAFTDQEREREINSGVNETFGDTDRIYRQVAAAARAGLVSMATTLYHLGHSKELVAAEELRAREKQREELLRETSGCAEYLEERQRESVEEQCHELALRNENGEVVAD